MTLMPSDKPYDVIADYARQAIIDGFRENLTADLAPFKEEIESYGGEVELILQEDLKDATITYHNLPDELISRINTSLEQE
ncbi:hypothetical protein GCM10028825_01690 [Spirosoma agri]